MTALLPTLVGGVIGILTGLLPTLLTSRRRRMLKLVVEESEALEKVHDPVANEDLRKALQATTWEYRGLVEVTPERAARDNLVLNGPMALVVGLWGFLVVYLARQGEDMFANDVVATIATVVGYLAGVMSFTVLGLLTGRLAAEHRKASRKRVKRTRELTQADQD